jgi:hypothetical protein
MKDPSVLSYVHFTASVGNAGVLAARSLKTSQAEDSKSSTSTTAHLPPHQDIVAIGSFERAINSPSDRSRNCAPQAWTREAGGWSRIAQAENRTPAHRDLRDRIRNAARNILRIDQRSSEDARSTSSTSFARAVEDSRLRSLGAACPNIVNSQPRKAPLLEIVCRDRRSEGKLRFHAD